MFQFYDSPIKSLCTVSIAFSIRGFNSMIVRLKGMVRYLNRRILIEFQFYDSPIKSMNMMQRKNTLILFQFYDSPIKSSVKERTGGIIPAGFNSMIVRLKEV